MPPLRRRLFHLGTQVLRRLMALPHRSKEPSCTVPWFWHSHSARCHSSRPTQRRPTSPARRVAVRQACTLSWQMDARGRVPFSHLGATGRQRPHELPEQRRQGVSAAGRHRGGPSRRAAPGLRQLWRGRLRLGVCVDIRAVAGLLRARGAVRAIRNAPRRRHVLLHRWQDLHADLRAEHGQPRLAAGREASGVRQRASRRRKAHRLRHGRSLVRDTEDRRWRLGETIAQEPGRLSSMVVPAWSAADEPAVVVRSHLPPGRTLTLVTDILPKDLSRRPAGFEIGALHAIRLDDERLLPPWVMTQRSDQSVHAAFKVTRSGAMCFFDPARDSRHHRVFSAFARLGVSTQIQNLRGHPKILSSPPAGRLEASYLSPDRVNKVTWWLDDQPAADTPFARPARIESLVTVVARKVPDGRGGRRTLPYAKSCDE
ncbi:hypothetical protein Ddc_23209 [Ditylenchus destructor]|nr:hypothetical protein Ddc_23209 [Ditylenchus destructor]